MASQFSINPTLFIGLGSTGYRIIDQIRKRIFEEFGCGGLPCFRYIILESDAGERKQHPDDFLGKNPKDYEKINAIDITLNDFQGLKSRIDPNNAKYNPGIAEWLDETVFMKTDQAFKAGAGNIRQIGRLCLWENIQKVRDLLDTARGEVVDAVKGIQDTTNFLLTDYLPRKKAQYDIPKDAKVVNNDIQVYVCGTLCGGTCSGSLVDIGYLIKHLLGLSKKPNLVGQTGSLVNAFFTIIDNKSTFEPKNRALTINCWAALKELDYYMHPGINYHAQYKDVAFDSDYEPYDLVYLAGLSNMGGQEFSGRSPEGLCEMIALNIFLEVAAGTASLKEKERVDIKKTDSRYLEPNSDQPDASWSGYMRCFIGFGLSAICYPRHQIATGISRRLGEIMCEKFQGDEKFSEGKDSMQQVAKDDCARFLDECENNLTATGKPGDTYARNMKNEISQLLDEGKKQYDDLSAEELKGFIEKFPPNKNEKLRDMFSPPHGSLYSIIVNQVDTVGERILANAIKNSLNSVLREKTVQEVIYYMDEILRLIMEQSKKLPKKEPSYSLKVDFSLGVHVHEDFLARLLLLRDKADLEYKQVKWDLFHNSIVEFLKQLVDYYLDQAIMAGLPEIKKLQQLIQSIQTAISKLRDRCQQTYEELIKYTPPSNMVIVCEDPKYFADSQKLTKDVEKGAAAILSGPAQRELPLVNALVKDDSLPLAIFSEKSSDDLLALIDQHYTKFAIDWVSRFDLGEQVLDKHHSKIELLLLWSFPYVNLNSKRFNRLMRKISTHYIFSHSKVLAERLEKEILEIKHDISFNKAETPLQHFIICYQEEPGLCLSDLEIMDPAEKALSESEIKRLKVGENAKPNEATNFTHRDGAIHFDVNQVNITNRINKNFERIFHLLKLMAKVFADAFEKTVLGQKTLAYKSKRDMPRTLYVEDKASLKTFFDQGFTEDNLWAILRPAMENMGNAAFGTYVGKYTSQIPGRNEREEAEKDFDKIQGIFFPTKEES